MVTGREPSAELVEPLSWTMWEGIRERSALDYLLARTQLTAIARGIVALWETYDVVMTPALAERPVPIGEIDACSDDPWEDFRRSGQFTPYTAIFNITGQPAISVPLFHGDDGLPTAIQLGGRPADEATLLSLAAQLEAARPWADRRPTLAVA
jgi:amidase